MEALRPAWERARPSRLLAALVGVAVLLVAGSTTPLQAARGPVEFGQSEAAARAAWSRLCGARRPAKRPRVLVSPKANLPHLVRARPAGTTFCIRAGIHRLAEPVEPETGDFFVGEPGAVLSGAKVIGPLFVRSGAFWVARGQSQQNPEVKGSCASGTACRYSDDVFFDSKPLVRVLDAASLAPGRFYFDYERDEIWIGSDPSHRRVEAATTPRAFRGSGSGADRVRIVGLVVEKFANEAQIGAINARASWVVANNEVRLNHGIGIQDAGTMVRNHVHHNGQMGVGGDWSTGSLVARNHIHHNNYAGFDIGWEAGGGKWLNTSRLTIRHNNVHDNDGPGLWTDTDNVATRYLDNVVARNSGPGILHETSYEAVIVRNVVSGNGRGAGGWVDGAGIVINTSRNVDINDNDVVANADGIGLVHTDRGAGRFGPHVLENVRVHGNRITMPSGHTGLVNNTGELSLYDGKGNTFEGNTYVLGCNPRPFAWVGEQPGRHYDYITKAAWVAAGNDTRGRFALRCPLRTG